MLTSVFEMFTITVTPDKYWFSMTIIFEVDSIQPFAILPYNYQSRGQVHFVTISSENYFDKALILTNKHLQKFKKRNTSSLLTQYMQCNLKKGLTKIEILPPDLDNQDYHTRYELMV